MKACYSIAYFIALFLFHVLYRLKITGRENVPDGGLLICANHSAYKDPVLIGLAMGCRGYVTFMLKSELMEVKGLGFILRHLHSIPVSRSEADLDAIRKSLAVLKSGKKLCIFPEGSRLSEGDQIGAKNGAAMLAIRSGVPILPVYVTRGPKKLFSRIIVNVGKPYYAQKESGLSTSEQYSAIARQLMDNIYSLAPPSASDAV